MHTVSTNACLFFLPIFPAFVDNTTRFTVYDNMTPFGLSGISHVRRAELEVILSMGTSGGSEIGPAASADDSKMTSV